MASKYDFQITILIMVKEGIAFNEEFKETTYMIIFQDQFSVHSSIELNA